MKDPTSSILRAAAFAAAAVALLSALIWAAFPEARAQAAGLLLGWVFGSISIWYLAMKIRQISILAAMHSKRRAGAGFFVRILLAVLAVAIAARRESYDLVWTIIGLAGAYLYGVIAAMAIMAKDK